MYLAVSDPQTVLSSGSVQVVEGLIVVVLAGVVWFLFKALMKERDARLQDLRDYQKQSKKLADEAVKKDRALYSKIETVKSGSI